MFKTRKRSRRWLTSVRAALFIAALPTSAMAESVLRYAASVEPPVLDPIANVLSVTQQHGFLIYDTLFSIGCDGQPKPQMIKDYRLSKGLDGATWTFTLRDELKFHDGADVTSTDVIASIKRWASRDLVGKKLESIGWTFAEISPTTFTITMPVVTSLLVSGFAKPTSPILFVTKADDAATPYNQPVPTRVGSGPFKFVEAEFVRGHKMVYERNAAYVPRKEPSDCLAGGKVAKVDKVEWMVLPDAATAVSALQSGEIDFFETPALDLVPILKTYPDIVVRNVNNLGRMALIRFNFQKPPFDKPEARLGLIKIINQLDALSVIAGSDPDLIRECYSYLACGGLNEFSPKDDTFQTDIEAAKRLFNEAGYNGEPIVMMTVGEDDAIRKMGTYTAEVMRSAGLNVDMQLMDFGTLLQKRLDKTAWNVFPMFNPGIELDNPLTNLSLADGCDLERGYPGWSCSPAINKLMDDWAREGDPVKAKQLIQRIGAESLKHMPYALLGLYQQPVAYRSNLTGVLNTPMPVMWNIEKQ